MRHRRPFPASASRQRGAAMMLAFFLATLAILAIFVRNLSVISYRAEHAGDAGANLNEGKNAVLGYVLTNADADGPGPALPIYWGVLPLPDMGPTRSPREGVAAINFAASGSLLGNSDESLLIGRLPWKSLGLLPLKDQSSNCLWYGVSAAFKTTNSAQPNFVPTFNWDTLGDFLVGNTNRPHMDRAVAVVFSPGNQRAEQTRTMTDPNFVNECGGNYVVSEYLESVSSPIGTTDGNQSIYVLPTPIRSPETPSDPSNYVATSINTDPSADRWLAITTDDVFKQIIPTGAVQKTVGALLPLVATCASDQDLPTGNLGAAAPRSTGPLPSTFPCPGVTGTGIKELARWRDNFWLSVCPPSEPGCLKLTPSDSAGPPATCDGILVFSGARKSALDPLVAQDRSTKKNKTDPTQYFESTLNAFLPNQAAKVELTARGSPPQRPDPETYLPDKANHPLYKIDLASFLGTLSTAITEDVASCLTRPNPSKVPVTGFQDVTPDIGGKTLVNRPDDNTITLGNPDLSSALIGSSAVGCTWNPQLAAFNNGYRFFFKVRIDDVGDGFNFALLDADTNVDANRCGGSGAQGELLGYAGTRTNNLTGQALSAPLEFPKIGLEFDTVLNRDATNPSYRNDPGYRHGALVYWGHSHDWPNPPYLSQYDDDNVHKLPAPGQTGYADPIADKYKIVSALSGPTPQDRTIYVRLDIERRYDPGQKKAEYRSRAWIRPEKWGTCTLIESGEWSSCTGIPQQGASLLGRYTGTVVSSTRGDVPPGMECELLATKDGVTGVGTLTMAIPDEDRILTVGIAQIDGNPADTVSRSLSTGQTTLVASAPDAPASVTLAGPTNGATATSHTISGDVSCSLTLTTANTNTPPISGMANTARDFVSITPELPELDQTVTIHDVGAAESFKNFRFGFTNAQSSRRQKITVTDIFADPR